MTTTEADDLIPGHDDPERPAIDDKLFPFLQGMLDEGIPAQPVCHALVNALLCMCLREYEMREVSRPWAKDFLQTCESSFKEAREVLENFEEGVEHAIRNIEAGGSGTHCQ